MLSVVMLNVIVLLVAMLSVVMLRVIVLSPVLLCRYAACRYAEYRVCITAFDKTQQKFEKTFLTFSEQALDSNPSPQDAEAGVLQLCYRC
jgi:hypothetical protein